jgi:hypothetical protein
MRGARGARGGGENEGIRQVRKRKRGPERRRGRRAGGQEGRRAGGGMMLN